MGDTRKLLRKDKTVLRSRLYWWWQKHTSQAFPGRGVSLAETNYPEEGIAVSHQKPTPAVGGWVHSPVKEIWVGHNIY